MVLIRLLLTFAKIGILGFGGGYAMIPLIQNEIALYGWLTEAEFADIVAVSQMTPGPVGVNAATFIGIRTAGLPGAVIATLGILLPSLFIVSIAAHMVQKFKENAILKAILSGIRPAAIGLIGSAVMFFATMSVFSGDIREGEFGISLQGLGIFLIVLVLNKRFKLHPIYCVILSAGLGILFFVYLPLWI